MIVPQVLCGGLILRCARLTTDISAAAGATGLAPELLVGFSERFGVLLHRHAHEVAVELNLRRKDRGPVVQVVAEDRFAHGRVVLSKEDVRVPEVIDCGADWKELARVLEAERHEAPVFTLDIVHVVGGVDTLFNHVTLDRGEIPRIQDFLTSELVRRAHWGLCPCTLNHGNLHFLPLSR